jgi:flap endonuclease-1
MDQFVDVCILAGCDYCDTIKGVAAVTAFKLVKEHGSLAAAVESLDKEKHPLPEGVDFVEVKSLFTAPEVTDPATIDLKWGEPDEAGLLQFLCKEKGFNEERIAPGIKKLAKAKTQGQQLRMDSFFQKVAPPPSSGGGGGGGGKGSSSSSSSSSGAKRKGEEKSKAGGGQASGKLKKGDK